MYIYIYVYMYVYIIYLPHNSQGPGNSGYSNGSRSRTSAPFPLAIAAAAGEPEFFLPAKEPSEGPCARTVLHQNQSHEGKNTCGLDSIDKLLDGGFAALRNGHIEDAQVFLQSIWRVVTEVINDHETLPPQLSKTKMDYIEHFTALVGSHHQLSEQSEAPGPSGRRRKRTKRGR